MFSLLSKTIVTFRSNPGANKVYLPRCTARKGEDGFLILILIEFFVTFRIFIDISYN